MKLSVTMPDELVKEIDEYSSENYMTRSGFLSFAATNYLASIKVQNTLKSLNLALSRIAETGQVDNETLKDLEKHVSLFNMLIK